MASLTTGQSLAQFAGLPGKVTAQGLGVATTHSASPSASSAFVLKIGLCPSFRTLKRASSGARDGIWIASPGEQTNSDGESSSSGCQRLRVFAVDLKEARCTQGGSRHFPLGDFR